MDHYHEQLIDRADYLRTERKDREMEEAYNRLEAETPETTTKAYYAFPPSGALGLKFKVVDTGFARDLERRLNVARAALKDIARNPGKIEGAVLAAGNIAREALIQITKKS